MWYATYRRALLHYTYALVLRGIYNTTYYHRCSANWLAGASRLEISNAQDTQGISDSGVCPGQLVRCPLPSIFNAFADEVPKSSVTITSIVRLIYLIKGYASMYAAEDDYSDILIWTNVEANTSIICGQ